MTVPCGVCGKGRAAAGFECHVRHTPNAVTIAAMSRRSCKLNEPEIPNQPNQVRPVTSDTRPKTIVSAPKRMPNALNISFRFTRRTPSRSTTTGKPAQRTKFCPVAAGAGAGVPAMVSTCVRNSLAFW